MATNIVVRGRRGEHPERLIKRFIRKVKKKGILEKVHERRYYEKPSVKKRKKKAQSIKRAKQEQEKRRRR